MTSVIDARERVGTLEKLKQHFLYQPGFLDTVGKSARKCLFPGRLQNPDKPWSGKENLAGGKQHSPLPRGIVSHGGSNAKSYELRAGAKQWSDCDQIFAHWILSGKRAGGAFELPPSLSNVHLAIEQQVRMNAVVVASHAKIIIEYSHPGINVIIDGEPAVG